ncbi:tetratricopeptide repeat protein [Fastidiosibacter lacustris]|uniref:tetratricopeptide repeat protein n=1 Tax=Fastidiosibacter lacustris TaxID=2056695 RepID=UPI000E353E58|nr:tetratricopeptide repeat protein [Fastidiosibacter lacustris]
MSKIRSFITNVGLLLLVMVLTSCASNTKSLSGVPEEVQVNYEKAAKINAQLAVVYAQRQMLDRAKEKLLKAKSQDRNVATIYYAEGLYYQNLGMPDKAEASYQKALHMAPSDFQAYNFYAQFLCTNKHQYDRANAFFKESISLSSNVNLAETFTLYGRCLLAQENYKLAQTFFEKAIDQGSSGSTLAYWELAQLEYQQKEYQDALTRINRYIELAGKTQESIRLKMDILQALGQYNEATSLRLQLSSNLYE